MAIYHLSIRKIKRSAGQSVVQRAAYALRASFYDQLKNKMRYNQNQHTAHLCFDLGTFLPSGAQVDPEKIWNAAEAAETRSNACTGRTMDFALPVELTQTEMVQISKEYAEWIRNTYGVVTTTALHLEHSHNPHSHIVMSSRKVDEKGNFQAKTRELDDLKKGKIEVERIRTAWAMLCNQYLESKGISPISNDSLYVQEIDKKPGTHLGIAKNYKKKKQEIEESKKLSEEYRHEYTRDRNKLLNVSEDSNRPRRKILSGIDSRSGGTKDSDGNNNKKQQRNGTIHTTGIKQNIYTGAKNNTDKRHGNNIISDRRNQRNTEESREENKQHREYIYEIGMKVWGICNGLTRLREQIMLRNAFMEVYTNDYREETKENETFRPRNY